MMLNNHIAFYFYCLEFKKPSNIKLITFAIMRNLIEWERKITLSSQSLSTLGKTS